MDWYFWVRRRSQRAAARARSRSARYLMAKARTSSADAVKTGETVGLEFDARTLTLFEPAGGRALLSQGNYGVLADG